MKQEIEQSRIEINSYVRVVNGDLFGKVYKVFGISDSSSFISIGVSHATSIVKIEDVIVTSEDDFNDNNQDDLLQGTSFF